MNFADLCNHFSQYGVNVDPYDNDSHWATNAFTMQQCQIEDLPVYSVPTLCHYFYELGIPSPIDMREDYNHYRGLRNHLFDTFKIPKVELTEGQNN